MAPAGQAGLLLSLTVAAWAWRPIRTLRDFFVVMLAFVPPQRRAGTIRR